MTEAEYLAACSKTPLLEWNVLFEEYCNPKTGTHFRLQGITSYDIKDDTVMFTSHNGIFISKMEQVKHKYIYIYIYRERERIY